MSECVFFMRFMLIRITKIIKKYKQYGEDRRLYVKYSQYKEKNADMV
jgi:hypothetical protein